MKNEKSSRQASAIMPKLIPTAGFNRNLNLPSENNEQTKQFLIAGAQDFILPGYPAGKGYRFVKSIEKHHYRLITDGDVPETVYVVELRFRNDIVAGKTTCTQIKVWRTTADKHRFAVADLPRRFFSWLLDTCHIVITDEEQTGDGRRFWEVMISWALGAGFYVYVSDGGKQDRPLFIIHDTESFFEYWSDFCWGHDPDIHTHRLIVISKTEIR